MKRNVSKLSSGVLKGDRLSISKAISAVENHNETYASFLKDIFPHTGHAFVVGITGPPGTGKSSLVDRLLKIYRSRGNRVAVLAVDPTSPVTGGAILGDRVRMISHTLDEGVYIRSMASRGDEGGLSHAARNAIRILDAAGNGIVLVETVGIGQAEVEVVKVADAVVVVLMPELGDEVQAAKAGLMEIGDIFAVNKSDLPGADKVLYNLHSVLTLKSGWRQCAVKVSAKTGGGLEELVSKIEEYRSFYEKSESLKERKLRNVSEELIQNVSSALVEYVKTRLDGSKYLEDLAERVLAKKIDPESATKLLLERFYLTRSDVISETNSKKRKKKRF